MKAVFLKDICDFEKGSTGLAKATPGKYPLVATGAVRRSCDSFQFDTKAVCVPLVSSTGHGHASLNNVHYQEGKFSLGSILVALTAKREDILDIQFLHLYLSELKDKVLVPLMSGAANVALSVTKIKNIEIPLPVISRQHEIVVQFKSIVAEEKELNAELAHQQTLLKKLRQQILQEAIEGKLTKDWREQNHPSAPAGHLPLSGEEFNDSPPDKGEYAKREGVKKLNNLPHLKTFRKSLRKSLTPAEAKLWTLLKGKQLKGKKFRRQHSIANYILDFYCPSEKLAIELDGEVHNNAQAAAYDRERDIFLAHTGIKVLRFENEIVFKNPDGLLASVEQALDSCSNLNPSALAGHLPLSGEELLSSPPVKGEYRKAGRGFEPASELLARIQAEKEQLIKDKKIKKQKPLLPLSKEETPFVLPTGWAWCRLNELILENPRNGYSPKTVEFPTGTKTLKLGATTTGKFIDTEIKYINEKIERDSFLWLEYGDILIQRGNSIDFVGVSAIYEGGEHQLIYPDLMMKLKPASLVSGKFLHHVLLSPYCREYFRDNASGAQKSMPKINQGVVSGALIPFCSLKEQKAIVTKVEKLLALCDNLEAQITNNQIHAEQLMQAVLKEAFSQNSGQVEKVTVNA